jgi:Leucine-rich repeat (LRR) protein
MIIVSLVLGSLLSSVDEPVQSGKDDPYPALKKLGARVMMGPSAGLTVTFEGTSVKDKDLRLLQRLPNLESVVLDLTDITGEGFVFLGKCRNLQNLHLSHTKTLKGENLKYLHACRKLKVLDLRLTSIRDKGLAHLKPLKNLEVLGLGNTKITSAGFVNLKDLGALKELYLYGNKGITDLKDLAGLTNLEVLYLNGCPIGDEDLRHLAGLEKLRQLRMDLTKVKGPGMAYLRKLKRLEVLYLWETEKDMANLANFPNMRELYIAKGAVADSDLEKINGMPKLEVLFLASCAGFTDKGLAKITKCRKLQQLDLGETGISGVLLEETLEHFPELKMLNLTKTKVPADKVKTLKAKFPKVKILY